MRVDVCVQISVRGCVCDIRQMGMLSGHVRVRSSSNETRIMCMWMLCVCVDAWTCKEACAHACIHMHTYTHTLTLLHTPTHTHTHTVSLPCLSEVCVSVKRDLFAREKSPIHTPNEAY